MEKAFASGMSGTNTCTFVADLYSIFSKSYNLNN